MRVWDFAGPYAYVYMLKAWKPRAKFHWFVFLSPTIRLFVRNSRRNSSIMYITSPGSMVYHYKDSFVCSRKQIIQRLHENMQALAVNNSSEGAWSNSGLDFCHPQYEIYMYYRMGHKSTLITPIMNSLMTIAAPNSVNKSRQGYLYASHNLLRNRCLYYKNRYLLIWVLIGPFV